MRDPGDVLREVLALLGDGTDLHDDTYLAQFLEALGTVLKEDSDLLSLVETFLDDNLENITVVNEDFVMKLSRIMIKAVPLSTLKISTKVVKTPKIQNRLESLHFYNQAFQSDDQCLELAKIIGEDNRVWEQVILGSILQQSKESLNTYLETAARQTLTSYTAFCLRASDSNPNPKGCWIKIQLEENLRSFVKVMQMKGQHGLFDYMKHILERLDPSHKGFVLSLLRDSVKFETILNNEEYLASQSMFFCFIEMMVFTNQKEKMKETLSCIVQSPSESLSVKKAVMINVIKEKELQSILVDVLDKFLQDSCSVDEETIKLAQYILSCYSNHHHLLDSISENELSKMVKVVTKFVSFYEQQSHLVSDKSLRTIIEFGRKMFSKTIVIREGEELVKSLMVIATSQMSVDAFIRSEALGLVSVMVTHGHSSGAVAISDLCLLCGDTRGLNSVQDSALQCLSSLLSVTTHHDMVSPADLATVHRVVTMTLASDNRLLKPSALALVRTLLVTRTCVQPAVDMVTTIYPAESVAGLDYCDLYSDEERREMVVLATQLWTHQVSVSHPGMASTLTNYMVKTILSDSNWEVKLLSAQFWSAVHSSSHHCHDRVTWLETHHFFTALLAGCQDYEEMVRTEYWKLVDSIELSKQHNNISKVIGEGTEIKRAKYSKEISIEEEADEDGVEDVVESNDKALMKILAMRKSPNSVETVNNVVRKVTFQEYCHAICDLKRDERMKVSEDPMTSLLSIMEDILQSCSDSCQLDLVDCY